VVTVPPGAVVTTPTALDRQDGVALVEITTLDLKRVTVIDGGRGKTRA
jgi:hypothetical protein